MILGKGIRAAVLATIAFALAATLVKAAPELSQTKPALRTQPWKLEIAARRPVMRPLASRVLKNNTPQSKHSCAAPQNVGSHHFPSTGLGAQWLSPSLLLRSTSFSPSRAPPLA